MPSISQNVSRFIKIGNKKFMIDYRCEKSIFFFFFALNHKFFYRFDSSILNNALKQ